VLRYLRLIIIIIVINIVIVVLLIVVLFKFLVSSIIKRNVVELIPSNRRLIGCRGFLEWCEVGGRCGATLNS